VNNDCRGQAFLRTIVPITYYTYVIIVFHEERSENRASLKGLPPKSPLVSLQARQFGQYRLHIASYNR